MKSYWIDEPLLYDGSQLRSLFAYLSYGLLGDSIVGWRGPCNIPEDKIVDGEDLLAGSVIRGGDMIHFIVERFHKDLYSGVLIQRLLAGILLETVRAVGENQNDMDKMSLVRKGDDVYLSNRKLNISIATQSPISNLIHFAFNCTNENTPVPTISLSDFKLDPKSTGVSIMEKLCHEINSIADATCKVRWVQ